MNGRPDDDDQHPADRRSAALIGLLVVVALAILAVVLVRELGRESQREDCLMAHRRDCGEIDAPSNP